MDNDRISESCERSFRNSQAFFEELGLAVSTLEPLIEKYGATDELRSLYIHLVKLKLSFLEQSKEYLGIVKEISTDTELKTFLETAGAENAEEISVTLSTLDKFK